MLQNHDIFNHIHVAKSYSLQIFGLLFRRIVMDLKIFCSCSTRLTRPLATLLAKTIANHLINLLWEMDALCLEEDKQSVIVAHLNQCLDLDSVTRPTLFLFLRGTAQWTMCLHPLINLVSNSFCFFKHQSRRLKINFNCN